MIIYFCPTSKDSRKLKEDKEKNGVIVKYVSDITFATGEYISMIKEFVAMFGIDKLREIYTEIGINFLDLVGVRGEYTVIDVLGEEPSKIIEKEAYELSTGERGLLYVILCKYLKKSAFIVGLLESLDYNHKKVLVKEFSNSSDGVEIMALNRYEQNGLDGIEWRFTRWQ